MHITRISLGGGGRNIQEKSPRRTRKCEFWSMENFLLKVIFQQKCRPSFQRFHERGVTQNMTIFCIFHGADRNLALNYTVGTAKHGEFVTVSSIYMNIRAVLFNLHGGGILACQGPWLLMKVVEQNCYLKSFYRNDQFMNVILSSKNSKTWIYEN